MTARIYKQNNSGAYLIKEAFIYTCEELLELLEAYGIKIPKNVLESDIKRLVAIYYIEENAA